MIDKSIGQRIKARRKELNMSQQELATLLGYKDRTAITHIENGTKSLMQPKIRPMIEALDVTVEWLMGWDAEDLDTTISKLSPADKEAVKKYIELMSKLTEEEKQEVVKHMEFLIYKRKE